MIMSSVNVQGKTIKQGQFFNKCLFKLYMTNYMFSLLVLITWKVHKMSCLCIVHHWLISLQTLLYYCFQRSLSLNLTLTHHSCFSSAITHSSYHSPSNIPYVNMCPPLFSCLYVISGSMLKKIKEEFTAYTKWKVSPVTTPNGRKLKPIRTK